MVQIGSLAHFAYPIGILKLSADTLAEICRYLQPRDLLRIAYSSKVMLTIFTNPVLSSCWKRARNNVEGFPGCPPDLSELQHAKLALCNRCHYCFRRRGSGDFHWQNGTHACATCVKGKIDSIGSLGLFRDVLDWPNDEHKDEHLIRHIFTVRVGTVKSEKLFSKLVPDWRKPANLLSTANVKAFQKQWDKLSYSDKTEFISLHKDRVRKIKEHARECDAWLKRVRGARTLELLGLHEFIPTYYCVNDGDRIDIYNITSTAQPSPTVRDKLVGLFKEQRYKLRKQAVRLRLQLLRDWIIHMEIAADDGAFPSIWDFAMDPFVREIIDAPPDTVVTPETFHALETNLKTFAGQWRKKVEEHMISRIPCRYRTSSEPFSLAITSFWICELCNKVRSYPDILAHVCEYKCEYETNSYEFLVQDAFRTADGLDMPGLESGVRTLRWERLSCMGDLAQRLVRLFSLDPESATFVEMNTVQERLVCLHEDCHKEEGESQYLALFTWRAAMRHYHHEPTEMLDLWRKATETEAKACIKIESSQKYMPGRIAKAWICRLCPLARSNGKLALRTRYEQIEHYELQHHGKLSNAEGSIGSLRWHLETFYNCRSIQLVFRRVAQEHQVEHEPLNDACINENV